MNDIFPIIPAIKALRPTHWSKNLALFAALIFAGQLTIPSSFSTVFWAFLAFNLITSATYIFNDLLDVKRDRLHPIKKNRPIASGKLPIQYAIVELLAVLFLGLILSEIISHLLFTLVIGYLVLQIAYTLFLKHLPIIDILIIASGFVIRVYAGAFIIDAHLSVWFLLCVISVALFLASGKRRAELQTVDLSTKTRESLQKYPTELLNSYVTMFGNAAWMSWALFTFFESPKANANLWLFLAELSKTTTINKLLMATIPVTIFAIMRYQSLIFSGKSEAPEKVLLTDIPLVTSVGIWVMMVVWILYSGASTFAL